MNGTGSKATWWNSEYWHFIKDTLWTMLVFVIVALAAFGLQHLIEILKENGAKPLLYQTLTIAEYFVLFADVAYLVISVGRHIVIFAIDCKRQISTARNQAKVG
ncbi:hypothetical protein K3X44_11440 [Aliiroseovarius crassostreae]|uniref:hypothetical protein n=1 Tax=Aliiroseovarius crassostreae TaxID=154981 RepID=UPI0022015C51|nr:hypothetical protein [Aliiroseovarius crassostreae]UWQ01103.1 hypothetical protein K3X44_11440 [Aliiroseovarius crassostreae]